MKTRVGEYDWEEIQQFHNHGNCLKSIYVRFGLSRKTLNAAIMQGMFVRVKIKNKPSLELRKHLSEKRKEWLLKNPDKHVWRRGGKFKSKPCEVLKDYLGVNGISFIEEHIPLSDRSFSIDIAFPDKKIGIEVNGNQHYNRDGTLKEYYQNRHDLIVNSGWRLKEIHYSDVWDKDFLDCLLGFLKNNIDFSVVYQKLKIDDLISECPGCGNKKGRKSKYCRKCNNKVNRYRKVECRPSAEELTQLVLKLPMVHVGKMFGVSDNAVRKWCKSYGIDMKRCSPE